MNNKLSWLMTCSLLVALAVLATACTTPTPTAAPTALPAPTTLIPTLTNAPSSTPTATPPAPILRFLAKGVVVQVPTTWWAHNVVGAHAVQFSMTDWLRVLDFNPAKQEFFWRDLEPTDLNTDTLIRCWREQRVAGLQQACFLDVSWVPAGGHILPLEKEEPAFGVELVDVNPEYDQVTFAFGDWSKNYGLPAGELPAPGETVWLIANYKGLVWELYPY